MSTPALVDGIETDAIAVTDSSVLRGDGCFESIRSYGGRLYALGWHLTRMERSAAMLGIPCPDLGSMRTWCEHVASFGDGVVRLVLTRGDAIPGLGERPRCVVIHTPLPSHLSVVRLGEVRAPWHPAGRPSELAGAKTLSYAPNLAASRSARSAGFDDALLIGDGDEILEGPTFSVAWVVEGQIETPTLDLYVLDSITRRTMMKLAHEEGRPVIEGVYTLDRIREASEVMAMSTVKEITPVTSVGDRRFDPGPITRLLASRFADAVRLRWGD